MRIKTHPRKRWFIDASHPQAYQTTIPPAANRVIGGVLHIACVRLIVLLVANVWEDEAAATKA